MKTLITLFAFAISASAYAQQEKGEEEQKQEHLWGIKAGVSFTDFIIDEKDIDEIYGPLYTDGRSSTSFHFGGFTRIHLKHFFIQPELMISFLSLNYANEFDWNTSNITRLELPVLLGLEFNRKIRLMAGPMFGVPLSSRLNTTPKSNNIDGFYDTPTLSLLAGLSLGHSNLEFEIHYEYGLTKISDRILANKRIDQYINQVVFSAAYTF